MGSSEARSHPIVFGVRTQVGPQHPLLGAGRASGLAVPREAFGPGPSVKALSEKFGAATRRGGEQRGGSSAAMGPGRRCPLRRRTSRLCLLDVLIGARVRRSG